MASAGSTIINTATVAGNIKNQGVSPTQAPSLLADGRPRRAAKDDGEDRGGAPAPIRLAIVSRQRLIRDALAVLVGVDDGIVVVNGPGNGSGPDDGERGANVTLVDMPTTAHDGIELLAAIQRKTLSPNCSC